MDRTSLFQRFFPWLILIFDEISINIKSLVVPDMLIDMHQTSTHVTRAGVPEQALTHFHSPLKLHSFLCFYSQWYTDQPAIFWTFHLLRGLRFSQQCSWRFKSSERLIYTDWWRITNVSGFRRSVTSPPARPQSRPLLISQTFHLISEPVVTQTGLYLA
jgi:hypothetical protein